MEQNTQANEYIALYRKYRPAVFSDVYGQEHITDVLKNEIMQQKVSHAYLFCGSRGTGKTTCAKILSKAVNCENPQNGDPCGVCASCLAAKDSFDITEMDAASNNGVDYIRELREDVVYPPSELKKRVFIIDEVHMLSIGAFNALLKTLEEPPSHALFILATTEVNKLPATILSRCKRFDFNRIPPETIAKALKVIAQKENIRLSDGAVMLISKLAAGAMRDALSMLELFAKNKPEISREQAAEILGVVGRGACISLVESIGSSDTEGALQTVAELYQKSKDMAVLCDELSGILRDMLIVKYTNNPEKYIEEDQQSVEELKQVCAKFSKEKILYCIEVAQTAQNRINAANFSSRAIFETAVMKMCDMRLVTTVEALNARIAALEQKLEGAVINGSPLKAEVVEDPKELEKIEEILKQQKNNDLPNTPAESENAEPAKKTKQNKSSQVSDINCYGDFAEAVGLVDPMLFSFISDGFAKLVDNTAVLFVGSIAMLMINTDKQKNVLATCLSKVLGKDVKIILKNKDMVKDKEKISLEDLKE